MTDMKKRTPGKLIDYSKLKFKVATSMRYDDVGDYFDNTIISYDMKNPIINNAIMLHEFVEFTLIRSAGIPVSLIDAFDTNDDAPDKYKKEYKLYCKYHRIANNVERHFIENMGMQWKTYQKAVYKVSVKVKPSKKKKIAKVSKTWRVR